MKPDLQPRRFELPIVWVFALIFLGVGYRLAVPVFGLPWNTAPLLAMAFGGGMLLAPRLWWIPVAALVVGDLLLGILSPGGGVGTYTLVSAGIYACVALFGSAARRRLPPWPAMWAGTMLCGVLFYGVSNTFVWLSLPEYSKTLAGWWQSQTVGLPQYSPPAWVFLRNSLLADTVWCAAALVAWVGLRKETGSSALAAEAG